MGISSYDDAGVSELVGFFYGGSYHNYNKDTLGLYRNYGVMIVMSKSKYFDSFFKQYKLKKEVESNLIAVDYLNECLNLFTGEYKPYRKPGYMPLCISIDSHHPAVVTKHLYKSIVNRLSTKSKNDIF